MSIESSSRQRLWSCEYEINSFLVNPQKRLGLYALLNLLQDAAWVHATHLGHGFDFVSEQKMAWVLTRQKVVMRVWPEWGERVRILTWVRPPSGAFAIRDFEVISEDQKIGEATASWILLNTESRRPVRADLKNFAEGCREDFQLSLEAPKIELSHEVETLARFEVRNSDLDLNQHVNNTRYAQWILDSIPRELHRKFLVEEYEVNFLAETHEQDRIAIQRVRQSSHLGAGWAQFQGWRESDQKIVFASRLKRWS